jgi:hypothetical protein
MNTTLLEESSFRESIKGQWGKLRKNIRSYPNEVMWWDKYINPKIQQAFQREGAERNRDRRPGKPLLWHDIPRDMRPVITGGKSFPSEEIGKQKSFDFIE